MTKHIDETLNDLYTALNQRKYVHPDPLEFLYDYDDLPNREVVGIVASALAFGNVGSILKSVKFVLDKMVPTPVRFLRQGSMTSFSDVFSDFKHRWADGAQLVSFLVGIKGAIQRYGSLQDTFLACINEDEPTLTETTRRFIAELMADTDDTCGSLLPTPAGRSACKRVHLFLRWMVRNDAVDPGGWDKVDPKKLIVPLDTHMHKIGLALKFTRRKTADMQTAMEITAGFQARQPEDPVRFDFALTRLGIRDDMDLAKFLDGINAKPDESTFGG